MLALSSGPPRKPVAGLAGLGMALRPPMMTRLDVQAIQAKRRVTALLHCRHVTQGMSVPSPSRRHKLAAVSACIGFVTERTGAVEADAVDGYLHGGCAIEQTTASSRR